MMLEGRARWGIGFCVVPQSRIASIPSCDRKPGRLRSNLCRSLLSFVSGRFPFPAGGAYRRERKMSVKKVAVIMGSDSDFPVVTPAIKRLKEFGIPVEVRVMSAHRTPDAAASFSANAVKDGFGVIIAAAGKAAHLAGVLAAHTTLPVIGIPIKSSTLDGLDALLATVQMPSGIPVASVAIDGAANAAILAAEILSISEPALEEKLKAMRAKMTQSVLEKDEKVSAAY